MPRKEISEEAVKEKRGMDEGPMPIGMDDIPRGIADFEIPKALVVKKNFQIKSPNGSRISARKGTHFEVEEGVLYLYDGEEIVGVYGLTNFCLEISNAPVGVE